MWDMDCFVTRQLHLPLLDFILPLQSHTLTMNLHKLSHLSTAQKNHELLRTVVYHRGNVKNDLNVVEYGLQETIFLVMLGRRSFSTRHEECEETIGNPVLTWKKFFLVFFTVSWVLQLNCNFYTQKLHNRTNCVLTVFLNNHN